MRILLAITFGAILAIAARALPLETTDRYGDAFVTYAQVDRADGTYRRMLTTPNVLSAVENGAEIPDGARILMETYYRPGSLSTVFQMRKDDGAWSFGSFNGNGTVDLTTRPQASCLSCHAGAAEQDFVFTRPSLERAGLQGEQALFCDRGGRRPCPLLTYSEGVSQ
ncbi:cytochrome P460 family protein [Cognatiyoonia sp. IB215182]|uniref:cytochrome P460 family protein n=1 Tax=Cognatiyoonia sp. IB215182 TaxID=3097353 RepID=UPI002A10E632|nr:cytochrome P460 family protein [Cognatiyoonia sp. IB215182]MDX8355023.1 cytochrome P460 family protein [Cognatiyoonia sp. IB215182]